MRNQQLIAETLRQHQGHKRSQVKVLDFGVAIFLNHGYYTLGARPIIKGRSLS